MTIAKRIIGAVMFALMMPATAFAQSYELNIGHVLNEKSSYQAGMTYFADTMSARTNGAFKTNIFPAAGLGGELRLVQGAMTGTVDAFIIGQPSLESTIPQFKILSLPFLFESEEQAVKLLRGSFGQKFLDLLPEYNLVGLGWAGVFSRGLPANKAVASLDDMSGMKVRVMQSPGYVETFAALGSQPTPIAFGELFMSLQTGVVDATDLSPDLVISGQFMDAISHYSKMRIHQLPSIFIISKSKFDSFPEDIQKLVLEVGSEATMVAIEEQRRAMADGLEAMAKKGIAITEPDQSQFEQAAKKAWPSILKDVPQADEFLAALEAAKKAE
ncbi:MAG: TRAP transporter substrate-binding protein [Flavobacteriaceae bacterium]